MGWGRTLLLGDIGNRLDIGDVERELAAIKHQLAGAQGGNFTQDEILRRLMAENAEMKLYLVALIRLLVKNGAVSQSDLQSVVASVDAQDGRVDGKFTGKMA